MITVLIYKATIRNLGPHSLARRVRDALSREGVPVRLSEDGESILLSEGSLRVKQIDDAVIYKWFPPKEPIPTEDNQSITAFV